MESVVLTHDHAALVLVVALLELSDSLVELVVSHLTFDSCVNVSSSTI